MTERLFKHADAELTNFLILLHHFPLLVEGPEPADLLLWLLGQEDVDLLAVFVAQFEGILHAHVEVIVAPVYSIPHLITVHIDAALIVQDVPAYQILRKRREMFMDVCVCVFGGVNKCLSLCDNTTPTLCNTITTETDMTYNNSVIVMPIIVTVAHG